MAWLIVATGGPAAADAGDLDTSFAGDGIFVFNGSDEGVAYGVLNLGGFTLAVGKVKNGGDTAEDFALMKLRPNGNLDNTFGDHGKVFTDFDGADDLAFDAVAYPGNKIVVVGEADIGGNDKFAVARYRRNGTLDTTFGGDGKCSTTFPDGDSEAVAATVLPNGKIIVVGTAYNGTDDDMAIARYRAAGCLDTTFGDGGLVTVDFGGGELGDEGADVALGASGKIVVAGEAWNGSDHDFAVVRLNGNGTPDSLFGGGDGKVTTDFGGGEDLSNEHSGDTPRALAIQGDGKIVVAGEVYINSGSAGGGGRNDDFGLVRYLTNGDLDPGFGIGGKAFYDFGFSTDSETDDEVFGIALQPDGKILVGGEAGISTDFDDFALARYKTDGFLDDTFGDGGVVTTDIGGNHDDALDIAYVPGTNVVVAAGFSEPDSGGKDLAVVRYKLT